MNQSQKIIGVFLGVVLIGLLLWGLSDQIICFFSETDFNC